MRFRSTALVLTALAATSAWAQAALQPYALGGVELSRDTDDFRSESYSAGGGLYLNADNNVDRIAYRHSETHYSTPGFSTHGEGDSLFGARAFEFGHTEVSGELTRQRLDVSDDKWLGFVQAAAHPTEPVNVEARFERNLVDSRASLEQGITYDALTLAADYQFTDRFNLAGVVGQLDFSDGNERPLYRAKANFLVSETYGLSMYVRGRQYSNSDPYNGNYFAPEDFRDWLAGFGMRRRLPWVRGTLSANIDWGRQDADGEVSPARTWLVRLESFRGPRWTYALTTGFSATAGAGGGDDYEYRYTSASVTWAF